MAHFSAPSISKMDVGTPGLRGDRTSSCAARERALLWNVSSKSRRGPSFGTSRRSFDEAPTSRAAPSRPDERRVGGVEDEDGAVGERARDQRLELRLRRDLRGYPEGSPRERRPQCRRGVQEHARSTLRIKCISR